MNDKNNVAVIKYSFFAHKEHWDNELWFFNNYMDGFLPILFFYLFLSLGL